VSLFHVQCADTPAAVNVTLSKPGRLRGTRGDLPGPRWWPPQVWQLGGRNLGQSYGEMVAGCRLTGRVVVTSLQVSGDAVSARVLADETTGAVQTCSRSYLVSGGSSYRGNRRCSGLADTVLSARSGSRPPVGGSAQAGCGQPAWWRRRAPSARPLRGCRAGHRDCREDAVWLVRPGRRATLAGGWIFGKVWSSMDRVLVHDSAFGSTARWSRTQPETRSAHRRRRLVPGPQAGGREAKSMCRMTGVRSRG